MNFYKAVDPEDATLIQYCKCKNELADNEFFRFIKISEEEYNKAISEPGWFIPVEE